MMNTELLILVTFGTVMTSETPMTFVILMTFVTLTLVTPKTFGTLTLEMLGESACVQYSPRQESECVSSTL